MWLHVTSTNPRHGICLQPSRLLAAPTYCSQIMHKIKIRTQRTPIPRSASASANHRRWWPPVWLPTVNITTVAPSIIVVDCFDGGVHHHPSHTLLPLKFHPWGSSALAVTLQPFELDIASALEYLLAWPGRRYVWLIWCGWVGRRGGGRGPGLCLLCFLLLYYNKSFPFTLPVFIFMRMYCGGNATAVSKADTTVDWTAQSRSWGWRKCR